MDLNIYDFQTQFSAKLENQWIDKNAKVFRHKCNENKINYQRKKETN